MHPGPKRHGAYPHLRRVVTWLPSQFPIGCHDSTSQRAGVCSREIHEVKRQPEPSARRFRGAGCPRSLGAAVRRRDRRPLHSEGSLLCTGLRPQKRLAPRASGVLWALPELRGGIRIHELARAGPHPRAAGPHQRDARDMEGTLRRAPSLPLEMRRLRLAHSCATVHPSGHSSVVDRELLLAGRSASCQPSGWEWCRCTSSALRRGARH